MQLASIYDKAYVYFRLCSILLRHLLQAAHVHACMLQHAMAKMLVHPMTALMFT